MEMSFQQEIEAKVNAMPSTAFKVVLFIVVKTKDCSVLGLGSSPFFLLELQRTFT